VSDVPRRLKRLTRGRFFLWLLLSLAFAGTVLFSLVIMSASIRGADAQTLAEGLGFSVLLGLAAAIVVIVTVIGRLRDIEESAAWSLLLFVPVLDILLLLVLLFVPGTHGTNRYGPDPRLCHNRPLRETAVSIQSSRFRAWDEVAGVEQENKETPIDTHPADRPRSA
jgi:uncharacterized membrane protein YhaH (DUF805 family)